MYMSMADLHEAWTIPGLGKCQRDDKYRVLASLKPGKRKFWVLHMDSAEKSIHNW